MMMKQLDIETLLKELTLEEKALLVAGHDFMRTHGIDRLGIPSILTSDGPHGLRKQVGSADNGISTSLPSTAFPTASAVASSWNPDNAKKIGQAARLELEEMLEERIHLFLFVKVRENWGDDPARYAEWNLDFRA